MGIILCLGLMLDAIHLPLPGRDFIQFWTAGRAVLQGLSPYDQAFEAKMQQANGWDLRREPIPFQPYFYPPWLAIGMWPLALLPYHTALSLWLAVSLVTLVMSVDWLMRAARRSARGRRTRPGR